MGICKAFRAQKDTPLLSKMPPSGTQKDENFTALEEEDKTTEVAQTSDRLFSGSHECQGSCRLRALFKDKIFLLRPCGLVLSDLQVPGTISRRDL